MKPATYEDGFVCAVPPARREESRPPAINASRAFQKRGALSVVDCWGNDVPEGKLTSFSPAVQRKPDETVVFSGGTGPSKQVRDEAWKLLMNDPDMPKDMPFDGQRLIYGGFELLSDV